MNSATRTARRCQRYAVAVLALPTLLSAHVKWFASYDETETPKAFFAVISPHFLAVGGLFLTMLFLAFLVDGFMAKSWPAFESSGWSFSAAQEKLVRLGTGAFFLCIWSLGLYILTPELHTKKTWVFGLQFLIALCTAWRPSCAVSALGIGALYFYAMTQYGFFHMLDYVYFLGLAFFLASIAFSKMRWSQLRTPVMTGCLAFSLIWTAIEKLLYPQWTRQILEKHSHMAMGMNFTLFIVIAAFVEFTLAFYLATGRGLLRLGAFALIIVFAAAMPEFGARDVVGHFPLIAMLGVPFIAGDSALQRFWRWDRRGVFVNAAVMCCVYVATLLTFIGLYYGVQWAEYRS